jgi:DNA-binding LacI/PurR family transcriptional regulator
VVEAVQAWIARGDLTRGAPLPPMRRLAQTLAVDKATVCRALSSLQDDGLVRRQGRRLHVSDKAAPATDQPGVLGNTVLIVTAADLKADQVRSSWLGKVTEGLLGEAHDQHCNAMVVHPGRLDSELPRLVAARPMGIVLLGVDRDAQTLPQLEATGLPVVLYGDEFEAHGHDMITPDHVRGTAELTRWLIEHGCRRILRVWSHRSSTRQRPIWLGHRDQGFEQAVTEAGLPLLPPVEFIRHDLAAVKEDHFDHRVREVAGRLVEHLVGPEPVDAIVLPTDGMVPEVAAACRLFGKEPNKDVLIAGYDNDWSQAVHRDREQTPPAVTTDHDTVHLGQALMQTLLRRAKDPAAPPQRIALPPRVVEVPLGLAEIRNRNTEDLA